MAFERKPVIHFPNVSKEQFNFTVLVTGHPVDKSTATRECFPEWSLLDYRTVVWGRLNAVNNKDNRTISRLVTPGRAGAELLAVNWAALNNRPTQIYLPYDRENFVIDSVNYGESKHNWDRIFNALGRRSQDQILTPVLEDGTAALKDQVERLSQSDDLPKQYEKDLNLKMLDQLKPTDLVLAVWDGEIESAPEMHHLVQEAAKRNIPFQILSDQVKDIVGKYKGI